MATNPDVVDRAIESVQERAAATANPVKEALALCGQALENNQRDIDDMLATARNANGALLELLSERANRLKVERERLRSEERRLKNELAPSEDRLDTAQLADLLSYSRT